MTDSNRTLMNGAEATILTLLAENPAEYRVKNLEAMFGEVRPEVRDIAAALLGEHELIQARTEEERNHIYELASRFKRGVEASRRSTRPYLWKAG